MPRAATARVEATTVPNRPGRRFGLGAEYEAWSNYLHICGRPCLPVGRSGYFCVLCELRAASDAGNSFQHLTSNFGVLYFQHGRRKESHERHHAVDYHGGACGCGVLLVQALDGLPVKLALAKSAALFPDSFSLQFAKLGRLCRGSARFACRTAEAAGSTSSFSFSF